MNDQISATLARLFETSRLVFWYDTERNMRDAFDALSLAGVEKVEIQNNEFGLKYRMLRLEPDQKFLIYHDGPVPEDTENWLLDLNLAYPVFSANQASIWRTEVGLPDTMDDLVHQHIEFFRAAERRDRLKQRVQDSQADVSQSQVQICMLSICAGVEGGIDGVMEALLGALARDRDDSWRLIQRAELTDFFWGQIQSRYGYDADKPDLEDFVLTLFENAYRRGLGEEGKLNREAILLLSHWKDVRTGADAFRTLSQKAQDDLCIPDDLAKRDIADLKGMDYFPCIDQHITDTLLAGLNARSIDPGRVIQIVQDRQQSFWFEDSKEIYLAIACAAKFLQALAMLDLRIGSLADGVQRYTSTGFRLDQLYRKFVSHMQKAGPSDPLQVVFDSLDKHYSNSFLVPLNDAWQDQVAGMAEWQVPDLLRQDRFYRDQVCAFRQSGQKVAVIISDALRFEVAEECQRAIRSMNRFDADLTPMLSMLPSYTQLGMAALLPNQDLTLTDEAGVVSFGLSSQGTDNREKILAMGREGDRVCAMQADTFSSLNTKQGKELFRDHDVLYLYHNRIDKVGEDDEPRLPQAAEDAIEDLKKLVTQLASANASNILITADHGFLYQHQPLEETDFSLARADGEILYKNRRFILGRKLGDTAGMKYFRSTDLGLNGDMEVLIPNSVNRLRLKGAGSRYVHGGASLQEVIVPILKVSKRRKTDLGFVSVEIFPPAGNIISAGQISIVFYQSQPADDKVRSRTLLVGIYAEDGALISDEHTLIFDMVSDNPREREKRQRFLLSQDASKYNNRTVHIKLREQIGQTSHYQDYREIKVILRQGMELDF